MRFVEQRHFHKIGALIRPGLVEKNPSLMCSRPSQLMNKRLLLGSIEPAANVGFWVSPSIYGNVAADDLDSS